MGFVSNAIKSFSHCWSFKMKKWPEPVAEMWQASSSGVPFHPNYIHPQFETVAGFLFVAVCKFYSSQNPHYQIEIKERHNCFKTGLILNTVCVGVYYVSHCVRKNLLSFWGYQLVSK